jgi:hypothetical protein
MSSVHAEVACRVVDVAVCVDQAGNDELTVELNAFGLLGDHDICGDAHGYDAAAAHDHRRIRDGRSLSAVDQLKSGERSNECRSARLVSLLWPGG